MFQLLESTEATLVTLTPRSEKHGDDEKPAVSLGLELTVGNEVLDSIDPDLAPRMFKHPTSKPLPGVRDALTVLACNSIDRIILPTKHEGWTLQVDDRIDETQPMSFGSCKVDKFSVEPHQGGSVTLRFRVGTSDIDAARSGFLGMHVGQAVWITLIAPKPGEEKKPEDKPREPDATDLFVAGANGGDSAAPAAQEPQRGEAWPFPQDQKPSDAPPQHLTEPKVSKAERKRLQAEGTA